MFFDQTIGFYYYTYTFDGRAVLQVFDPTTTYGGVEQQMQMLQASLATPQQLAHQPASLPFEVQSVPDAQQACNQTTTDDLINLVFNQDDELPETPEVTEIAIDLGNSLPSPTQESSPMLSPYSSTEVLPSIRSLTPDVHLPPPINIVKSQYPYTDVPHRPYTARQPSLSLPSMHFPRIGNPQRQTLPSPRVSFDESPPSSPSPPSNSPKRNKKNFTKEFNNLFQDFLKNNDHAANEWHLYSQRHKGKCTIKRAPCIKVSRGFCASYGREFAGLAGEEKYGALGTRTECNCRHKASPLCSSSATSVSRKQRVRSTPYPLPPARDEAPSSPEAELVFQRPAQVPLSKQAWQSYVEQQAPILLEGFNSILGGAQCTQCGARRAFETSKEVTKYLIRESIPCTLAGCEGTMQIHQ